MTATNSRPPRAETASPSRSWIVPVALLALAPKCLGCALAYAGLGVSLGLAGPELCSAPPPAGDWLLGLAAAGVALLLLRFVLPRRLRP